MVQAIFSRFRNAQVRDLVWVMAAPNLLTEADWLVSDRECTELLGAAMPQLLALDQAPAPLLAWLGARRPERLGPYFESLVAYWLAFLIDADWYATNKIVRSDRNTVGEFDLLWRSASGLLHHWELSVKLYLQVHRDQGFAGYIGTVNQDRLDLKVARLRDKQLHLARTAEGSAALPQAGEAVRAQALFKGWLFYPLPVPAFPAAGLSERHSRGWWAHWHSRELKLQPQLGWCKLERLSWLAPAYRSDASELRDATDFSAELRVHFAGASAPLLVAGLSPVESGWEEATRGFIVQAVGNQRVENFL